MQGTWMCVLALSALAQLGLGFSITSAEVTTPVGRVVSLLQGLQTKLEQDFKAEKSLFERYECWYKSVVDTKIATNAAAQSRKDSLETYIQDIEAGKFEFTTERVDLEKQISGLSEDLQVAQGLRTKESEDYEAAKQEMEQAVAALEQAIGVLEGARPSSLLARHSIVSAVTARESMEEALRLSRSSLVSSDLQFFERMVEGDVPQWDWKKLNRKATFKTKYSSQTGRILKTLQTLKETFNANLVEANEKERDAQASYDSLKSSKEAILGNAQQALVDLVAEHGARDLTKSEAQAEVDALGEQITADTQFISETRDAYSTKEQEWANRQRLRQMEMSAIAEAISVLHNDEARDVLKTSYKSEGYLFFQYSQKNANAYPHQAKFVQTLQKLAAASGDHRLSLLATEALSGTRTIAAVITAIDNLVASLRSEEESDLTHKEQCESQRQEKTRLAKTQSRATDELTDEIVRAQTKVVELQAQIQEQTETVFTLNGTLVGMERQRTDENAQYEQDKIDDQQAVLLIREAVAVLTKLKEDLLAGLAVKSNVSRPIARDTEDTSMVQSRAVGFTGVHLHGDGHAAGTTKVAGGSAANVAPERHSALIHAHSSVSRKQPFDVRAGEAPPPPPATWADPTYTGSPNEQKGIHAILELLIDDIEADIAAADEAETKAVEAYGRQKGDIEAAIQAAEEAITGYETEKATEDETIVNKGGERTSKKGELDATMGEIRALEPGCDFFLVNYGVRRTSRQIEIDGLVKAKAFLQGATFA